MTLEELARSWEIYAGILKNNSEEDPDPLHRGLTRAHAQGIEACVAGLRTWIAQERKPEPPTSPASLTIGTRARFSNRRGRVVGIDASMPALFVEVQWDDNGQTGSYRYDILTFE